MNKKKTAEGIIKIKEENIEKRVEKKKVEIKVHLEKFLNMNSKYTRMQKAILKSKFKAEMHTESKWREIIEREFSRRIT